jgi:hypothetical protein
VRFQHVIITIIAALLLLLVFFSPALSMDDPGFIIERMVISGKIVDLEPIAVGEVFSAVTEKVYCFLETRDIDEDTSVSLVWYFENKEMSRVSLPLTKGPRWRTYSSKKLGGLKGDWKVELQDSSGIVHNSVTFQVQ